MSEGSRSSRSLRLLHSILLDARVAAAFDPFPTWGTVAAISAASDIPCRLIARHSTWHRNSASSATTAQSLIYFIMHKPAGCLSARHEEWSSAATSTIYDHLPCDGTYPDVPHVGRLDRDSSGLILFTDDGELSNAMRNSTGAAGALSGKTYRVAVRGLRWCDADCLWARGLSCSDGISSPDGSASAPRLDFRKREHRSARAQLEALCQPYVYCSGGPPGSPSCVERSRSLPARVRILSFDGSSEGEGSAAAPPRAGAASANGARVDTTDITAGRKRARGAVGSARGSCAVLEFTLVDGKNRQIRRICKRSALSVLSLHRVRFGPLELGDLPCGAVRGLSAKEVQQCYAASGANAAPSFTCPVPLPLPLTPPPPTLTSAEAAEAVANARATLAQQS